MNRATCEPTQAWLEFAWFGLGSFINKQSMNKNLESFIK
jgi:hypothetical protein